MCPNLRSQSGQNTALLTTALRHSTGQTKVVVIGGRTIQYQPGLDFEAMALPSMNGFVISDRAFVSETELAKTLAHELHRLTTSVAFATGVINAELAKKETEAAYYFAEKAGAQILKNE
jgi:hypothetical protein